MSLRTRLDRLEREFGIADGRCPTCYGRPDRLILFDRFHDSDGDEVDSGEPCPDCGWAPKVTVIVERVIETREEAEQLAREGKLGLLG